MVAVISSTGIRLMPTSNYRARKLLKKGRAKIFKYRPFTIQLLDREDGDTQPIEFKCDTGYQNIGVSICSEKHEYVSKECTLLRDEVERHNDCRKYRRTRRNRLRYRKPRWSNRKNLICRDGFAPSIRNKRDRHIDLFNIYHEVMPITSAVFEMGQFDTQLLKALENGDPVPQGADYQHGERYGTETLREAVFTRDGYKCIICGRTPFRNNAKLHEHHVGFWKGDRTNRLSNLATVCEKCHTSKNHKQGGKLYGLEPKIKNMADATFMTIVRYDMFDRLRELAPDVEFHMTYGAATKLKRKELGIKKSHANDAYAMGDFHPKHRADTVYYQKHRRNNRILEKFYDAKYIDIRDGSKKSGSQLSCNRTDRSIKRNNNQNERIYRGEKLSKGRRNIRRKRYPIQNDDIALYSGKRYAVSGTMHYGTYVKLNDGPECISVKNIQIIKHQGSWINIKKEALGQK